ncbi:hypothetical protein EDD86DRAFT_203237 [Gorgonomyces haynaldii]|nr:hypothetical protein EDD86DRAFT_203237 [Gorgonomyces haynaldii]
MWRRWFSLKVFKQENEHKLLDLIHRQSVILHSRASGPGGQNVNKSQSKVELQFPLSQFPVQFQDMVKQAYPNAVSKKDFLMVSSDASRSQIQNQQECIQRTYRMLLDLLVIRETDPEKQKHVQQLIAKEKERKKRDKQYQSFKKSFRSGSH